MEKKNAKRKLTKSLFECQRNGLTIRGTEYRPEGENLSIAIVSHGFMAFQDTVRHYAKGQEYTNADDILLMGCSQGGFVSALVAAKQKENIKRLILFYPALCIPDDARSGKMMFAKFDPQNIPDIIKCGPMTLGKCYEADVIDMNPFEEIKKYQRDVLIVNGTADKIVNPDYAKKAKEAYLEVNENRVVKLEFIENGAHGFSKKHDVLALNAIKEFLA